LLESIRNDKGMQKALGLVFGIVFGIFLQKSGVTQYRVIIGQLLLVDFTVLKVMMSAVAVGTLGVHLLHQRGLANLRPRSGSFGSTVIGGLIFGAGFALLGYCPGTAIGAAGQGSLDALVGGVAGLLLGSWLFVVLYPKLTPFLSRGQFRQVTLQQVFHLGTWQTVIPVVILIVLLFLGLRGLGY